MQSVSVVNSSPNLKLANMFRRQIRQILCSPNIPAIQYSYENDAVPITCIFVKSSMSYVHVAIDPCVYFIGETAT